jgi:hypothetical protein
MRADTCLVAADEAPLVIEDDGERLPPVPVAFDEKAYLEPISQVTPRIMAAVGFTWGMCFFVLMALLDPRHLMTLLGFSLLGGSTFGLVWGGWFSWYVKRFHRHLLQAPHDFFAPQPLLESEGRVLELLGNQRVGRLFVGGKLVLTEKALWFVPHNRNGRAYRVPTRLDLGDVIDLDLLPRGQLESWLTGSRPDLFPGRLRIATRRGAFEFNVGTREMIAALVAELTRRLPGARQVEMAVESGSLQLALADGAI